jgi:ABC-2 type transport system ATP-binding protein
MPNARPAVWAKSLVRAFGAETAVDEVSLEVQRGEFYGLLGPNGAGKTTTIKMMVGLLRPTSGSAGIGAFDTWAEPIEVKRRIGVLPEEFNLYERLTGAELLDFTAAVHRIPTAEARKRRDELLELLDLGDAAHRLVGEYSRGMKKKTALAAAVIHAPPVLFLDEPFEGVDAVSARLIKGLLKRYTQQGSTIIFSSHAMELVERLCTRVGIMNHGRMLVEASPDELRAAYGVDTVEDAFLAVVGAVDLGEGLEWLGASSG